MKDVVLAIDQGTTGSTALLLDANVRVVAQHNVEFPNYYPQPGWVEHDPEEIWASVGTAVRAAVEKAGDVRIVGVGITNQRETSLFWDRKTGVPIHRALVWQDRRTADRCQALKDQGRESWVREHTGLVLDPYFSGTKAAWLLDNVDGARRRAEQGELCFGRSTPGVATHGRRVTDEQCLAHAPFDLHEARLVAPRSAAGAARVSADDRGQRGAIRTDEGRAVPPMGSVAGMAGDRRLALYRASMLRRRQRVHVRDGRVRPHEHRAQRGGERTRVADAVGWRLDGAVLRARGARSSQRGGQWRATARLLPLVGGDRSARRIGAGRQRRDVRAGAHGSAALASEAGFPRGAHARAPAGRHRSWCSGAITDILVSMGSTRARRSWAKVDGGAARATFMHPRPTYSGAVRTTDGARNHGARQPSSPAGWGFGIDRRDTRCMGRGSAFRPRMDEQARAARRALGGALRRA
jgi:hypothetical protein